MAVGCLSPWLEACCAPGQDRPALPAWALEGPLQSSVCFLLQGSTIKMIIDTFPPLLQKTLKTWDIRRRKSGHPRARCLLGVTGPLPLRNIRCLFPLPRCTFLSQLPVLTRRLYLLVSLRAIICKCVESCHGRLRLLQLVGQPWACLSVLEPLVRGLCLGLGSQPEWARRETSSRAAAESPCSAESYTQHLS